MKRIAFVASLALLMAVPATAGSADRTDPAGIREVSSVQDSKKKLKTVTFAVSMHCENCTKKIRENVGFEKGVKDMNISLDKKTVTVTFDPAKTDVSKLKAAIEKLGYKAEEV